MLILIGLLYHLLPTRKRETSISIYQEMKPPNPNARGPRHIEVRNLANSNESPRGGSVPVMAAKDDEQVNSRLPGGPADLHRHAMAGKPWMRRSGSNLASSCVQ